MHRRRPRADGSSTSALLVDLVTNTLDPGYAGRPPRAAADPAGAAGAIDQAVVALGCVLIGFMLAVAYVSTHRAAPEAAKVHADLVARVRAARGSADGTRAGGPAADHQDRLAAQRGTVRRRARCAGQLQADAVAGRDDGGRRPGHRWSPWPIRRADRDRRRRTGAAARRSAATQLLTDRDVRSVVNELWADGAEAISVNNMRLTPTSAIRFAGEAVLVDFEPITPPYVIRAIGNADRLDTGFAASAVASRYQTLASVDGIGFSFDERSKLDLPAGTVRNRHATRARSAPSTRRARSPAPAVPRAQERRNDRGPRPGRRHRRRPDPASDRARTGSSPTCRSRWWPRSTRSSAAPGPGWTSIFDAKVFVVSFISNVVVAALIVFLGDKLGVGGAALDRGRRRARHPDLRQRRRHPPAHLPRMSGPDGPDADDRRRGSDNAEPDNADPTSAPRADEPVDRPAPAIATPPTIRRAAALIGVLLALLGFGIAVQVHSNSSSDSLSSARDDDLIGILDDQNSRADRLRQQIAALQATEQQLQASGNRDSVALAQAQQQEQALRHPARHAAGDRAGQSRSTITDPQHKLKAEDLLDVVEELRGAGAEAIQFGSGPGEHVDRVHRPGPVAASRSTARDRARRTPCSRSATRRPCDTALQIPGGVRPLPARPAATRS